MISYQNSVLPYTTSSEPRLDLYKNTALQKYCCDANEYMRRYLKDFISSALGNVDIIRHQLYHSTILTRSAALGSSLLFYRGKYAVNVPFIKP